MATSDTPDSFRNSARRGTGFTPSSGREPWAEVPVTFSSTASAPRAMSIANLPPWLSYLRTKAALAASNFAATAARSPPLSVAVAVWGMALAEAAPLIAVMAVVAVAAGSAASAGKNTLSAPEPFSATTAGYLLSSTML
ncbi:hypothetical protein D3C72_1509100 [compost metagenome]